MLNMPALFGMIFNDNSDIFASTLLLCGLPNEGPAKIIPEKGNFFFYFKKLRIIRHPTPSPKAKRGIPL